MVGILAVADFRNSESWNQARLAVCAILELTDLLSRRFEYHKLAKNIEHLSIAVLDNIAKGRDGSGDSNFLTRAANTIDLLEQELLSVQQTGVLTDEDSAFLRENLDAVKSSLQQLE